MPTFDFVFCSDCDNAGNPADPIVIDPNGPKLPEMKIKVIPSDSNITIKYITFNVKLTVNTALIGGTEEFSDASKRSKDGVVKFKGVTALGGKLTGTASAKYKVPGKIGKKTPKQDIVINKVIGENPESAQVETYLETKELKALVYNLTGYKMFKSDGSPNRKGDRWGIMQIKAPDIDQIWNWKENCREGKGVFHAIKDEVAAYPASLRALHGGVLSNIPDFNASQLRMMAWNAYVSNKPYYQPAKKDPAKNEWFWTVDPNAGSFAGKCKKTYDQI
ncbi:MAG: hypothetical protein GY751_21350 [Bacteroidetes bacterium]|nr:hypothetical protein [Bacteroidota bacterium]